ncbi:MAG: DUF3800 domain-containing protein [Bacteroidetes bacterium]|nr:DUF3800 domain-containing protein [Bacteroidota bacterium]
MEYIVFSDESRYNQGRFRSIAAVSFPYGSSNSYLDFSNELKSIINSAHAGEMKWTKVKGSRSQDINRAKHATNFVISSLTRGLRIDTIIWDITDSRHDIVGRDDIANFSRMYFHLHRNLIERRGANSNWHLYPDQQHSIDWDTINQCLDSDGPWERLTQDTLLFEELKHLKPHIKAFKPVESSETPFIQLADLFAGMASYSCERSGQIKLLMKEAKGQPNLFNETTSDDQITRTDTARFEVIWNFYLQCKRNSLGVSLETNGYFLTHHPQNPINFWHYHPQHSLDKAPRKTKGLVSQYRRYRG